MSEAEIKYSERLDETSLWKSSEEFIRCVQTIHNLLSVTLALRPLPQLCIVVCDSDLWYARYYWLCGYYQVCMFTGLARLLQLMWKRWFKFAISFTCSILQTFGRFASIAYRHPSHLIRLVGWLKLYNPFMSLYVQLSCLSSQHHSRAPTVFDPCSCKQEKRRPLLPWSNANIIGQK